MPRPSSENEGERETTNTIFQWISVSIKGLTIANRRMFSKLIIRTDYFTEMPQTAQNLYFHLGLEADDDGFVTPKMVMKTLGSSEDDLKVLIAKGFVVPFESGVIVIRHWKENNYIQADRYKPTLYQDEYKKICGDNVYKLDTQGRGVEGSLGKKRGRISFNEKQQKEMFIPGTGRV